MATGGPGGEVESPRPRAHNAPGVVTPIRREATTSAPPRSFPDSALLLVAHGAPRFADADQALQAHAATLRARGCFAAVAVAFLNGAPSPAEALAALSPRIVHVVPFFMEQGWFVREAVPRALAPGNQDRNQDRNQDGNQDGNRDGNRDGNEEKKQDRNQDGNQDRNRDGNQDGSDDRNRDGGGHDLRFHPPVGVHPALAALAAARLQRACPDHEANVAVLLVGHGSARAPGRPMALHRHAATLSGLRRFAQVRAAFLEEPPLVADALRDWRGETVAVLGCFAGDGGHVRQDLPGLLAAERAARGADGPPLLDLGTIGDDPAMPDIILDQVGM